MKLMVESPLSPSRRWIAFLAAWMLLVHAGIAIVGLRQQSVTIDEYAHLPAGLSHWQKQTFFVYRVNPPLVTMLAALPVLFTNPQMPYDDTFVAKPGERYEWPFGRKFMVANWGRYHDLFVLGRLPIVAMSVLGGWLLFRWGREMYGDRAGLVAVALWSFCPNVLANAQLITPDVGCTTAFIACGYVWWRWLRNPSWGGATVAGVVLGIGMLTKFTLLAVYPIWLILLLIAFFRSGGRVLPVRLMQYLIVCLVSLVIINAGYLFEGTGKALGDYDFSSKALRADRMTSAPAGLDANGVPVKKYRLVNDNRFRGTCLERMPVPLPEHLVYGFDLQRRDLEGFGRSSYLRGELRDRGWWHYYVYALGVKLPLGTLVLLGIAGFGLLFPIFRGCALDEWCVLFPPVFLLILVSSHTGFNHHLRYVLPIFPFLFLHIGRLLRRVPTPTNRWLIGVVAACLLWNIGAAVRIHPHHLSYFNELAGGPERGGEHLINSNLDWGQDLIFLKKWLDEHPEATPLRLAYFNFVDPRVYGIEFQLPPMSVYGEIPRLPPGCYAVSASLVYGMGFNIPDGEGGRAGVPPEAFSYFRNYQPVAKAGYSIFIYIIPPRD